MLSITCQAMDETTIHNFRHLLERLGLTDAIFAEVNAHFTVKCITLRSDTLADATIIDAPSSTRTTPKREIPRCRPRRREMTGSSV
jgi:hypothetical protein